jgi:hypothetical protein
LEPEGFSRSDSRQDHEAERVPIKQIRMLEQSSDVLLLEYLLLVLFVSCGHV